MADRDDHRLFGDQVFQIDVAEFFAADLRAASIAVLLAEFLQIVLDDLQNILLVGQNPQVFGDLFQQLPVFAAQLFLFEVDQLAERHAQDGIGLHGGQRVVRPPRPVPPGTVESRLRPAPAASSPPGHSTPIRPTLASACVLRGADDANDLVDIGQGQQQAFDRVLALPRARQQELASGGGSPSRGAA